VFHSFYEYPNGKKPIYCKQVYRYQKLLLKKANSERHKIARQLQPFNIEKYIEIQKDNESGIDGVNVYVNIDLIDDENGISFNDSILKKVYTKLIQNGYDYAGIAHSENERELNWHLFCKDID